MLRMRPIFYNQKVIFVDEAAIDGEDEPKGSKEDKNWLKRIVEGVG